MRGRLLGLGAVASGVAFVGGQIAYAGLRRLPGGEDFDPSGVFGDDTLPALRIAVLGDSAVTGQGLACVDDSWPRIMARRLTDRYHVVLRSFAVGGAKSCDVLEDQVSAAEQHRYDLSIVSVGSNDVLRMVPVWQFERHLDEIVFRLKEVSRSVVLFGVGDLGSIPRFPYPVDRIAAGSGHLADRVHHRVAERNGVAKIDQWALTTEAFNSGLDMFASDLFHPSAKGHLAWADALMPTVEAELATVANIRTTIARRGLSSRGERGSGLSAHTLPV